MAEQETRVFLVRRFSNISDNWTPWDKSFDVVEAARTKVLDPGVGAQEFDVVEVQVVRRVRVSAVVEAVDVSDLTPPPEPSQP